MAGDCSGTAEFLGQPLVGGEGFAALGGSGPRRIDPQRMLTQPLGDAERFHGAEAGDSLGPVLILPAAHSIPVAGHVSVDIVSDHAASLFPPGADEIRRRGVTMRPASARVRRVVGGFCILENARRLVLMTTDRKSTRLN